MPVNLLFYDDINNVGRIIMINVKQQNFFNYSAHDEKHRSE